MERPRNTAPIRTPSTVAQVQLTALLAILSEMRLARSPQFDASTVGFNVIQGCDSNVINGPENKFDPKNEWNLGLTRGRLFFCFLTVANVFGVCES